MKTGRNAPCPCGSGKKYKHCCLDRQSSWSKKQKLLVASIVLVILAMALTVALSIRNFNPEPNRVWSEEHQHWHPGP